MEKKVKRIILCSDGTGNKGGYGDDSNVYKLYTRVEIRPQNDKTQQIVFYDNGVGTQSNKFIRALSGAFGFGLEKNIRDLHEFLGRHYEDGDEIYLFGFSRGAATVRAFAGMLQVCGLVRFIGSEITEEEFQKRLDKAIKLYRTFDPESGQDTPIPDHFGPAPKIHFMGIWDTVSALGFPTGWRVSVGKFFDWLDRLSDKICFPYCICLRHRQYLYQPDKVVKNVCHALAMDDDRLTFSPKVWNEFKAKEAGVQVEQVWFAGAHSNVGGGYPRPGMSDVTLHWMMVHAHRHGLEFVPNAIEEIAARANVHDKLYDPRDGLAIFYRYQPRNLEALCYLGNTPSSPGKVEAGGIKIHQSALERMALETSGYATTFPPFQFQVVQTPDHKTKPEAKPEPKPEPKPLPPVIVQSDPSDKAWDEKVATTLAKVKARTNLYLLFLESSLLLILLALPLWANPPRLSGTTLAFASGLQNHVWEVVRYVLPEFLEPAAWYAIFVHGSIFLILLALGIILYISRTCWVVPGLDEAKAVMRNSIVHAWKNAPANPAPQPVDRKPSSKNMLAKIHYFMALSIPLPVFIIILFIYNVNYFLHRGFDLPLSEKATCNLFKATISPACASMGDATELDVQAQAYWNPTCMELKKGNAYKIHLNPETKWKDASQDATAKGWMEEEGLFFGFQRRLWGRDPDQKLFRLSAAIDAPCPDGAKRCPQPIHNFPVDNDGVFRAEADGHLLLFANDLPFMYCNNKGSQHVVVTPAYGNDFTTTGQPIPLANETSLYPDSTICDLIVWGFDTFEKLKKL